jgi:hypothetical protein
VAVINSAKELQQQQPSVSEKNLCVCGDEKKIFLFGTPVDDQMIRAGSR